MDRNRLIVWCAVKARRRYGLSGLTHASFGDCNAVCKLTSSLLGQQDIDSKVRGHGFIYDLSEGESFEHSYVLVDGHILDPTIDQFFSPLDVDLHTAVPGVYFSHPDWDGDWLKERYQ